MGDTRCELRLLKTVWDMKALVLGTYDSWNQQVRQTHFSFPLKLFSVTETDVSVRHLVKHSPSVLPPYPAFIRTFIDMWVVHLQIHSTPLHKSGMSPLLILLTSHTSHTAMERHQN